MAAHFHLGAEQADLEAEQAYIDHAYDCLEMTRQAASRMRTMVEVGRGGTEQARFERDVIFDTMLSRLAQLDVGEAALCFGRIDMAADGRPGDAAANGRQDGTAANGRSGDTGANGHQGEVSADGVFGDTYYIGRVAVSDDHQEPVIVDWRAPVAEPFYRATGRQPMGLARRRHFATKGRTLLGMEDELFGDSVSALGLPEGETDGDGSSQGRAGAVKGHGALISALETNRSGRLTDIVATIQGEQDEVIRAEMPGLLVVQGGPGSGKTVVALHRAAYLLYTHRFPLEGQGVLVVGPNRLFLGYIEQVLPSLGEAGVELAVLADLVPDARIAGYERGAAARVKGDPRMAELLARAVRDRQRPLRGDLVVGYGLQRLRLPRAASERIVGEARRRYRRHNPGRRFVEQEVYSELAASGRGDLSPMVVRDRLRSTPELREALEWMWPVLTPEQLLHDLLGSKALLRSAGGRLFGDEELEALHRPWAASSAEAVFTHDDAPLLDEAKVLLGPRPKRRKGQSPPDDEIRTYGHIVVDEAQDLSPMQLRMIARRSLNGSMTVVGDIAQATGQWASSSWDDVTSHLARKRPPRRAELTIGYRLPAPIMDLAARVLSEATPGITPPVSIRQDGAEPTIIEAGSATGPGGLLESVADATRVELAAVDPGHVAVVCPLSLVDAVSEALAAHGIEHGQATRHGLDQQVTVVPVSLVKGLEVDAVVVVEPGSIVEEEAQGLRALYVALTRATKRLAIVSYLPLPPCLRDPAGG